MKFHHSTTSIFSSTAASLLFLSFICGSDFFKVVDGAVDCSSSTTIGRSENGRLDVCDHFEGLEHDEYLEWYNSSNIQSAYTNSIYLRGSDPSNPQNGASVHWKVDDSYVYIAVAARATGWLGFGIGEAGGMKGADMALFTASNPTELTDAYTTDELVPKIDDCSGDWELLNSNVGDDFIMFETKRLLDTNDPQDKPIIDDASNFISPHRIIAAWGDSDTWSYHGLNRARGSIRFHGLGDEEATFKAEMDKAAEGSFLVSSQEYTVPSNETTHYGYTCFSRQDLVDQGVPDIDNVNVIGWEPVVEDANIAYVHHFIVYGSTQGLCPDTTEISADQFQELSYVWAPGEGGLALPEYLGSPLFGENNFNAFMVEVHYDNPALTPGIIDSSGVRMYWTTQPREYQVGIMSVGDPNIGLFGQPVGDGLSKHEFICPSSCSETVGQEVTVLREYLHLHETGKRIVNEQIRDGEVIRKGTVEHWDFHQNGNAAVQQEPFTVKPGDGFKTTCFYNDQRGATFGLASAEEMCMSFLYYYPRAMIDAGEVSFPWTCGYDLGFPACDATYTGTSLTSDDELDREFGVAPDECSAVDAADSPSHSPSAAAQKSVSMLIGCTASCILFLVNIVA
eukprot:CAMPEP_0113520084 /NCGR_PEP_ID=MMETSP0014_2-20120614/43882_1 /TAXON_ID=2857 /ORGANISM="Nitzschia sp." /LENGTH=621 /DNA_ID=CAMNT_0000417881 /DNA_START=159 /DNA_END=2024 /DNA_ORIENTATION=+ /assembly_acc=CAM_ASM_000159